MRPAWLLLPVLLVARAGWAAPVEIVSFRADPAVINPGGTTTLSWDTRAAFSCDLQPEIGKVVPPAAGSTQVAPSATTTYILTCEGGGGPVEGRTEVRVQPPPEVTSIRAEPAVVAAGAPSTVSWSSRNADRCRFDPDGESIPLDGSREVRPQATTTYGVTCSGVGPDATRSVTVTVEPVRILSFRVEPIGPIGPKETVTLSWQTEWASSCAIEPEIGTVATSGSREVVPGRSKTYTLTCQGLGGPVRSGVSIEVRPVRIVSFTADPAAIARGGSSTLRWEVADADSCAIEPGVGIVDVPAGSREVQPAADTTYELTCTGQDGPAGRSARVEVGPPEITSLSANPDKVTRYNQNVSVSWTTVRARSCTLTKDRETFAVPVNGSKNVSGWWQGDNPIALVCAGIGEASRTINVEAHLVP